MNSAFFTTHCILYLLSFVLDDNINYSCGKKRKKLIFLFGNFKKIKGVFELNSYCNIKCRSNREKKRNNVF